MPTPLLPVPPSLSPLVTASWFSIEDKRIFKNFYLFIYLFIFGCVGSLLLRTCFLQLLRAGATLPCGAWASHCSGFSCCGARALGTRAQQLWLAGSRAQAQLLWCTGLVAPWHVGSSQTRDRTRVPCTGRRILFFNLFVLFIYFWLHWIFIVVSGLLIVVASFVAEHGLYV